MCVVVFSGGFGPSQGICVSPYDLGEEEGLVDYVVEELAGYESTDDVSKGDPPVQVTRCNPAFQCRLVSYFGFSLKRLTVLQGGRKLGKRHLRKLLKAVCGGCLEGTKSTQEKVTACCLCTILIFLVSPFAVHFGGSSYHASTLSRALLTEISVLAARCSPELRDPTSSQTQHGPRTFFFVITRFALAFANKPESSGNFAAAENESDIGPDNYGISFHLHDDPDWPTSAGYSWRLKHPSDSKTE